MRLESVVRATVRPGRGWMTLCVVLAWTVVTVFLALHHVVWRDEVRALSLALQGDSFREMLRQLSDGHPGLWHTLLRGAHWLVPTPAVLPVVSMAVALAAVALLAFRSPFGLPVVALFLLGRAPLYEYSVMARNYGISMLIMFVFAALYQRCRERGLALGITLFLLANSNVHSAMLAAVWLLFWLLDLLLDKARGRAALRNFALNAAIAALGIAVCAATVFPTANDLAQLDWTGKSVARELGLGLLMPGHLFADFIVQRVGSMLGLLERPWFGFFSDLLMSLLLVGSTLGLVRRPAAVVAALTALLGMSCLFALVYNGAYRHQALWLVFLVSLYWIVGDGPSQQVVGSASAASWTGRIRSLGLALFGLLLVIQALFGLYMFKRTALDGEPESRSRDLAQLIARRPDLAEAAIVADPDYLVEPLSYYHLPNPTYLMRERRFGNIVTFTRHARVRLSLGEILEEARQLRAARQRPVVILLSERLDPSAPPRTVKESYAWELTTTPEEVVSFLSATRKLASFGPVTSGETFDVYVLD